VDYLPLFVDLRGRSCLVVGAGTVARRKIDLLLRAGARITVVAPEVCDEVAALGAAGRIEIEPRRFRDADVAERSLVVAATPDQTVNASVYRAARAANVLVNTVDAAASSTAIFPAIVDRDPVLVAVSTGGSSPTLARTVRAWIEAALPRELGRLATFVRARRTAVAQRMTSVGSRQKFWQAVIEGPVAELAMRGRDEEAASAFDDQLRRGVPSGSVTLIGAGPGDPELLTLKGLRALQRADVVMYDNLVARPILDYARRDAELVYVGKKRRFPGIRQESINALLVDHARAGRNVVRLKGGDPFVFGRGGEEIASLAGEGVDCLVIPGITAALGAASYAGVPLTYRSVAQSVRLVTGHRANDEINLDWCDNADPTQTLVIYMGLFGLEEIMSRLMRGGTPGDVPAMLIEHATLPAQRERVATVATIAAAARQAQVEGPTTVIVGEVIRYRTGPRGSSAGGG
jgi:uroporphyrin-III C-methyltransferase/precorrin-2 dehydrogenase/sirohydrochlorin ferrochelatase